MYGSALHNVLREQRAFDRSFLPLVCWIKASAAFLGYLVRRYIKREEHAIHVLFYSYYNLFKAHHASAITRSLLLIVESIIIRAFQKGTASYDALGRGEPISAKHIRLLEEAGIVLKLPGYSNRRTVEKGVVLLVYTERFRTFHRCVDVPAVLRDYNLVFEPSWSGHATGDILYFTLFSEYPIIVMAPEKRDFHFLKKLQSNLIPVCMGNGEWVNPTVFRPLEGSRKQYDAVMIARWATYKRQHVLFKAVRDVRHLNFRVAVVADPWPGKRDEVELLIDYYGISENVAIFEALTPNEVNKVLNQSKVNLVLSLQEGGNRSLFEGFFADVPGIALRNNVGIQKNHFNAQTGKLIAEKDLAKELLYFREHWRDFSPRRWALANIAPEITTARLNDVLKRLAVSRGEQWTSDIVPKCNAPNPRYYPTEAAGRGLPSMREILTHYAGSDKMRDLILGS